MKTTNSPKLSVGSRVKIMKEDKINYLSTVNPDFKLDDSVEKLIHDFCRDIVLRHDCINDFIKDFCSPSLNM